MTEPLALGFAADRPRLVALAARVLGSASEAEDVVQDAWLRLAASREPVADPRAWLSTVVARAAIDRLRRRRRRAETPIDAEAAGLPDPGPTPEAEALLADAVGIALRIVLDRLSPAERVAFVLHDLFGLPFADVGHALGRTAEAARQLASRARRRVGAAPAAAPDRSARATQAALVAAFAAAARGGRLDELLRLLDPEVTLRVDGALLPSGALATVRGAEPVARRASAGAGAAAIMLVDGLPGLVVAAQGRPERVLAFRAAGGRIVAIEVIAEPGRVSRLDLRLLPEALGRMVARPGGR